MSGDASPLIIPIFITHAGCPHRCAFCNQDTITGTGTSPPPAVGERIDAFLSACRPTSRPVYVAFYGGNFLGLPDTEIRMLLTVADGYVRCGRIDGIRFSTRPDTIDSKRLDLLSPYPVHAIELGVQSMDEKVLALSRRGHSAADTAAAVARLRARGYHIGLQLMVGLPGDDEARAMDTAHRVAALFPDFVRIYPTVVLTGSPLARWYARGDYTPWPLSRCVSLVKRMLLLFQEKKIRVIRMGLQATADLDGGEGILAGPYHPAFGHLVFSEIYLDRATALLNAAGISGEMAGRTVGIRVHPRCVSKMRGQKNENIRRLQQQFGLAGVAVIADASMADGQMTLA